ncbi:retron-type reverse transcriptase [Bradyrhizobium sp. GM7.3]
MKCEWALLYIERWLTASMEKDGKLVERIRGTPQGGVISPLLANLSYIMRLISGWRGHIPTFLGVAMRTTVRHEGAKRR